MTCLFSWLENSKGACIKAFRDDFVQLKYFLIDSYEQELSKEFCFDLISCKLVFKLIYITISLYDAIHVISFRKTILISTIGTHEEIIYQPESGRQVLYNKCWRKYPVS